MKRNLWFILFSILIGLIIYFFGFISGIAWQKEHVDIEAIDKAIYTLDYARESHQYFVDNPDEAYYAEEENQDAGWVEAYSEIIDLLEDFKE